MELMQAKRVLEDNGYECEEVQTMKGSCLVKGLAIGSGQIKPTIYGVSIEDIEEDSEILSIADRITSVQPDINISVILNQDYLKAHTVSCIRHATDDDRHVKWNVYGDLEEYMRVDLGEDNNGHMSVCVTDQILFTAGMTADELRTYARRNLRDQAVIKNMSEILIEMMGGMEELGEMMESEPTMYVASNSSRLHGAAVILCEDLLQEFCTSHNLNSLYIIPSSLHEVILLSPMMGEETINEMIQDVNRTQVDEWDKLSDHVYHFVAA